MIRKIGHLVNKGNIAPEILTTCLHALVDFGVVILLGSMLGTLSDSITIAQYLVWPIVTLLQGIPPIAMNYSFYRQHLGTPHRISLATGSNSVCLLNEMKAISMTQLHLGFVDRSFWEPK